MPKNHAFMAESRVTDQACLKAPFGWVQVVATDERLTGIEVLAGGDPEGAERRPISPVLKTMVRQLEGYFDDPLAPLIVPPLSGTPFQQRVWQALIRIPPGQAVTYGTLACQLDSGARAVAAACKANALPILIPCHRVVAAQGLGGYCGQREGPLLEIKRWLLRHEGYWQEAPDAG